MRPRWWGLGGLLALSACLFDPAVPQAATVVCAAPGDCPPGLSCNALTHRCVRGVPDETPPALASVVQRYLALGEAAALGLDVDAVGQSSVVTLELTATEPLSGDPVLQACELHCAATASAPGFASFSCSAPDASVTGPCDVTAHLVDLAGNEADVPVATVEVDTEPPPAPDTLDGGFVYSRTPWGSATAGLQPRYTVSWDPGGLSADARWLWAGQANHLRGLTETRDAGALTLDASDDPRLSVRAFDRAGNASPTVPVHDVAWVATLGFKQEGSTFENPHRAQTVTAFGPALERADVAEVGALLGLPDGGGIDVAGAGSWERRFTGVPSAPAANGVMAADPVRGRVVAFGGFLAGAFGSSPLGSTSEWNGSSWRLRPLIDPEGDGSPTGGGVMVFDPVQKVTWLFSSFGVAWSWNGDSWAMRGRIAAGLPLRAAWDEASSRHIVFAVHSEIDAGVSVPIKQWWSFNGNQWQPLDGGGGPEPRPAGWAQSATDRRRGQLYVYSDPPDGGSLWLLQGDRWTALAGQEPGLTDGLCFDEVRDRLEAFGVVGGTVVAADFTAGGWQTASLALDGGDLGPVVSLVHTVWDAARGRTLLVTSHASGAVATWLWDGAVFQLVDGAPRDLALVSAAGLTCSVPGGGCLAAGGWVDRDASTPIFGAVSRMTETGWVPVIEPATVATPAYAPLTMTCPGIPRLASVPQGLLFANGALPPSLYLWDAGWSGTPPDAGIGLVTAMVATQGGALAVVQGTNVWDYDGSAWLAGPALPQAAMEASSAVADGGVLVVQFLPSLVGGYGTTTLSQLTPTGWVQRTPPPFGNGLAMIWNDARHRLISYAGYGLGALGSYSVPTNEIFEEDGAAWRQVAISDPEGDGNPDRRLNPAFDYDAARDVGVLVSGFDGNPTPPGWYGDTWLLHVAKHRPALVFRVDMRPALVPPEASVTSVQLSAVAGGQGTDGGAPVSGVQPWFWRAGLWTPAGTPTSFDVSAPGLVEASEARPLYLRDFPIHSEVGLALTPVGSNGADFAQLHVDSVEFVVHYHLP